MVIGWSETRLNYDQNAPTAQGDLSATSSKITVVHLQNRLCKVCGVRNPVFQFAVLGKYLRKHPQYLGNLNMWSLKFGTGVKGMSGFW